MKDDEEMTPKQLAEVDQAFEAAKEQLRDKGVVANEQIEGLDITVIREALGLKPFEQFRAETKLSLKTYPRGSGRTTEMLVQAMAEMSKGRKVAILSPNIEVGRELVACLNKWTERVFAKTGFIIHNLARAVCQEDWADQNEVVLKEHTFDFEEDQ